MPWRALTTERVATPRPRSPKDGEEGATDGAAANTTRRASITARDPTSSGDQKPEFAFEACFSASDAIWPLNQKDF
jgi:hypothetical protein